MSHLIAAAFASSLGEGTPDEVVYLPEGEHDITPTVDGKARRITVRVPADKGEMIAANLQAALEHRLSSNVRPWFDFEHKGGKAAALPTAFRYQPGTGIMASVEWTGAGRAAIEGKDFSYLSPTFLVDANGIPSGLPERGPLAALVNEPAFREIPRIAAKDAETDLTPAPMSQLILAALAIDPSDENAETEAVTAIEKLKADIEMHKAAAAKLEAELDSMKVETAAATKARYTGLVDAAIAAGKIAPKDEETKTQTLELLEASEALGVKFIAALPKQFDALDQPLVNASESNGKGDSATRVEASLAKARQELGDSANFQTVWARAADLDPAAFEA